MVLRKTFRDVSLDVHSELRALLVAQNGRTKTHPHGVAFGDCHVGNLFHLPGETIAVDWATVAAEPIGADGGSMIGSMLGRAGLVEVIRNERALFECYLEGLRASGWQGERDDIRRGYFCQFGHYLVSTVGLMPVAVEHGDWPKAVMESRLEAPWEEIQDMLAQVVATYPAYLAEVMELAERQVFHAGRFRLRVRDEAFRSTERLRSGFDRFQPTALFGPMVQFRGAGQRGVADGLRLLVNASPRWPVLC